MRWREGLAFAVAARRYWVGVFPEVRRQRERCRKRALSIPDNELRQAALLTIERKWSHSEGAAAFAVLLPKKVRPAFVQMAIAYELMIDYLDTISEWPVSDPWANTLQLHRAAQDAVAPAAPRERDYYLFHSHRNDNGFLSEQVATVRTILTSLPSFRLVGGRAEHLAALYAEAQAICHVEHTGRGSIGPTTRIDAAAAKNSELSRDEVLAACNTSIPLLALMALAAHPGSSEAEVNEWFSAYFPWVASLHILLHSLADEVDDLEAGNFNQFAHYRSRREATGALASIALRARAELSRLPQPHMHEAIFAGMVGHYLAAPSVWEGQNRPIADLVLRASGPAAGWAMRVHSLSGLS